MRGGLTSWQLVATGRRPAIRNRGCAGGTGGASAPPAAPEHARHSVSGDRGHKLPACEPSVPLGRACEWAADLWNRPPFGGTGDCVLKGGFVSVAGSLARKAHKLAACGHDFGLTVSDCATLKGRAASRRHSVSEAAGSVRQIWRTRRTETRAEPRCRGSLQPLGPSTRPRPMPFFVARQRLGVEPHAQSGRVGDRNGAVFHEQLFRHKMLGHVVVERAA